VTSPLLELRDIRAAYGAIEVLHGIDLRVGQGQIVALLGPNGAGKTTIIKTASGAMRPSRGRLFLAGHDVTGVPANALARVGVCTVPEGRGVFPNLTVRENLLMATYGGPPLSTIEERAYTRFPRLSERRTQVAGTLSGGEQQMLALARALAVDPAVLLIDELSMGLAPLVVSQLYEVVAQIAADGVGVLVVEQFARTVLGIADWAIVLSGGLVRRAGAPADIGDDALAAAYLGGT
jgi:branched-chain amino acid transport system ATP-binding protein